MDEKTEVEIVNDSIIPELIEFLQGKRFDGRINEFMEQHCDAFDSILDEKMSEIEWNHDHKLIFDRFQEMVDDLFDEFARSHKATLSYIQECCKDIVDGRYAPLFQEDENLWIVEELLSFADFERFLVKMCNYWRKSRSKEDYKSRK